MSRPGAPLSTVLSGTGRSRPERRRVRGFFVVTGLAVLALVGTAFALPMVVVDSSWTLGTSGRIDCATGTEVVFEHGLDVAENTIITAVRVSGVDTQCAGSFLALAIYNSSGTLIDEIVWSVSVFPDDTTITLIADGVATSSANRSSGVVTEIFPQNQTDPEGFVDNVSVASIAEVEILTLSQSRAARE